MTPKTHTLILQSAKMITPGVRHLSFVRQDGEPFLYIAGQFITLHFEDQGKLLRRSYSVASIRGVDATLDFAASYVKGGLGTQLLFDLQPGQTVEASGPHGKLVLRDEPMARCILVGTGTGITPYRSMLPEIEQRAREKNIQTVIMQGVQGPEDLLYGQDFLDYAVRNPTQIIFQAYYSRRQPATPQAHEFSGHVQVGFPSLNLDPARDIIYLCGNPNMIDEAFASLQAQGFSSASLRREKYISSK